MWKSKLSSCELDVITSKEQVELVLEKTDVSYDLVILDRYLGDVDSLEYLYPKKLKAVFNCPIVLSSNAVLGEEEINDIDLEIGLEGRRGERVRVPLPLTRGWEVEEDILTKLREAPPWLEDRHTQDVRAGQHSEGQ